MICLMGFIVLWQQEQVLAVISCLIPCCNIQFKWGWVICICESVALVFRPQISHSLHHNFYVKMWLWNVVVLFSQCYSPGPALCVLQYSCVCGPCTSALVCLPAVSSLTDSPSFLKKVNQYFGWPLTWPAQLNNGILGTLNGLALLQRAD